MNVVNIDAYSFENRWMNMNLKDASKGKLQFIEYVLDVVQPIERTYYRYRADDYLSFLHPVCEPKVSLPLAPVYRLESFYYENVAMYLHTIPIYLREEEPSVKPDDGIIDSLGAYYLGRNGKSPYIELYMKAIKQNSKGNDVLFKWLYTTVLLHELAHAALDVFNTDHGLCDIRHANLYYSEFGRWWEEAMANAMALKIIKQYGDPELYAYAKTFMQSQPAEYALGVLMEDFTNEEFSNVIIAKIQGVEEERQTRWLQYAKNKPSAKGLKDWEHLFFRHMISEDEFPRR